MRPAPVHEHIYSDGKICLNILYNDWKPHLDIKGVCLSLLSMLSSAKVCGRRASRLANACKMTWARRRCQRSLVWCGTHVAQSKKRPPDNDSTVVMSQGQKTRNMQWEFHDDDC